MTLLFLLTLVLTAAAPLFFRLSLQLLLRRNLTQDIRRGDAARLAAGTVTATAPAFIIIHATGTAAARHEGERRVDGLCGLVSKHATVAMIAEHLYNQH